MNTSFEVVPEGFVPAEMTPLENFLAKFVAIKYVIARERCRSGLTSIHQAMSSGSVPTQAFRLCGPARSASSNRCASGEHVVLVSWVFNAMHCDGLGDVIERNCLGPGEIAYVRVSFEVTPGAPQSH